ncbi:MAG TPA: hypothetical protein VI387_05180, partial [Candidatus Brocadiales bacterium]|nr:hypothetical protein [Candidatus Brocadiales bacterium]
MSLDKGVMNRLFATANLPQARLRFARNDCLWFDSRIYYLLIFAISAFGFYLRIRGIAWGIPLEANWLMSYHFDEGTYLMGVGKIHPSSLDFNVHDFHWGTVQFYLVGIAIKIAQLFGYVDKSWGRLFSQFDMQEATRV